jgi:hypothetical protein
VVESSGLLNRRRPLKSTGGSNPPLSASNNGLYDSTPADGIVILLIRREQSERLGFPRLTTLEACHVGKGRPNDGI